MKHSEFHTFLHDFLRVHMPLHRDLSCNTIRSYKQAFKQLRLYLRDEKGIPFEDMSFDHLDRATLSGYFSWLKNEKGLKAASVNSRMAAVKSFLKYCGERDISLQMYYEQASTVHAYKKTEGDGFRYLTRDQTEALFSTPDTERKIGRRDRFILMFLYETGARIQEAMDVKIGDIVSDGTCRKVRLKGKGNKVRFIPLREDFLPHLDAYLQEFHLASDNDATLFYTRHNGKPTPMSAGTVNARMKVYEDILRKADSAFPAGLHPHTLRHSKGMAMYKAGIPISYIRDFLGHVSIDTTMIYARADEEIIRSALESLEPIAADDADAPKKAWKGREAELLVFCGLDD